MLGLKLIDVSNISVEYHSVSPDWWNCRAGLFDGLAPDGHQAITKNNDESLVLHICVDKK